MISMPAITSRDIGYCEKVTGKGLRAVSSLPALTSLILCGCEELTDTGLRAVSSHACAHLPRHQQLQEGDGSW